MEGVAEVVSDGAGWERGRDAERPRRKEREGQEKLLDVGGCM